MYPIYCSFVNNRDAGMTRDGVEKFEQRSVVLWEASRCVVALKIKPKVMSLLLRSWLKCGAASDKEKAAREVRESCYDRPTDMASV